MPRVEKRLSWRKRIVFNLLMVIVGWSIVECLSLGFHLFQYGTLEFQGWRRLSVASQQPNLPGGTGYVAPSVIHPYVGAIQQPIAPSGERFKITDFGFVDEGSPIHKRSPDRLIVAIVGGSVARQFSLNATDFLAQELSNVPEFSGRTFQFVRLAGNGYKQPQQLMVMNYMLSMGAEFDVLINLDGLNEIALPNIDNIPFGVNSAFPRNWAQLTLEHATPEYIRLAGQIAYLREQQRDLARFSGGFPWVYSPTSRLIWCLRDDRFIHDIAERQHVMSDLVKDQLSFVSTGPTEKFESTQDVYRHCIELWCRSSILLHRVCSANGIRYFHFLQPNQYLPGSKPIGAVEAAKAIAKDNQMGVAVQACFPTMKTETRQLLEDAGVNFADLTFVFAEHPEPLYSDVCCHLTGAADLILASAIANHIRQSVAMQSDIPRPE